MRVLGEVPLIQPLIGNLTLSFRGHEVFSAD